MDRTDQSVERDDYRLALVIPRTHQLLTERPGAALCLPRISLSKWTRPAEQVQQIVQETWGMHVLTLDCLALSQDAPPCIVVEVLSSRLPDVLILKDIDHIAATELNEQERIILAAMIVGDAQERGPFSRVGWIDEAIAWLHAEVPGCEVLPNEIRQFNASAQFALLRFSTRDGERYWLKATGEPNRHEYNINVLLSEICSQYVPPLVATRPDWNAWLMRDTGGRLEKDMSQPVLEHVVSRLAELQKTTLSFTDELIAAGASNQRVGVLRKHLPQIIEYLSDAMERQTSTKVPGVERDRLSELQFIFQDVCFRMEDVGIPDTLIHNDISPGNVLFDGSNVFFTDWCEASIGNPFLSFQHLCVLAGGDRMAFRAAYRQCWLSELSPLQIDQAFVFMPLLAILSYLYGRGEWLRSERRHSPHFESYARSLARHMDREARNPHLLEVLCR
jgi:hypothetical protein